MNIEDIVADVKAEVDRAMSLHGPMLTFHDMYGVILEEVDEVWDEVKKKHPDRLNLHKELVQVAAMAIRAIHDMEL